MTHKQRVCWLISTLVLMVLCTTPLDSYAAISNAGVLNKVVEKFQTSSAMWAGTITNAASWLFWVLASISFAWTFGMMALKKADIGEFFAEFVRFILFVGFFFWLLINAPAFSKAIIDGLKTLAGNASKNPYATDPSGIVDIGFFVFNKIIAVTKDWAILDSIVAILMALAILVVLTYTAVNMLLLLISGWILSYAGIFYLGFGGSRWTSDIAINYYKSVLGIAMQLFTMVLIVGIGKTFIDDLANQMSSKNIPMSELAVLLVTSLAILVLSNKVPPMIAGIISGAPIGSSGIGQAGTGAVIGAAAGVAAGSATSMSGAKSLAASVGGASQAMSAAFKAGRSNASNARSISNGNTASAEAGSAPSPFSQASGTDTQAATKPTSSKSSSPGFLAKSTTAQTAGALAKGAWGNVSSSASNAMAKTTGGKLAQTIKAQNQTQSSSTASQSPNISFQDGNSIQNPTAQDEIKQFVQKNQETPS